MSTRPPSRLPAFLKSPDAAWRWVKKNVDLDADEPGFDDFYRERARDYTHRAQKIVEAGRVRLYRAVTVSRQLGLRGINFDCLGKAWSVEQSGAKTQGMVPDITDPVEVVLVGEVEARWIDWEYGLTSFMHYGEDQWEISLLEDAPVIVTGLIGRFRRDFDKPIQGNVGKAGEVWMNTCPETFSPRDVNWQLDGVSASVFDRAKAHYGTTDNPYNAGYMLPDGTMLDFSEGGGQGRTLDHRNIGVVFPRSDDEPYVKMHRFVAAGALRMAQFNLFDRAKRGLGFSAHKRPTREQVLAIRHAVSAYQPSWFLAERVSKDGIELNSSQVEERPSADEVEAVIAEVWESKAIRR